MKSTAETIYHLKVSVKFHKSLTLCAIQFPHSSNGEIYPPILFHWLVENKQIMYVQTH